MPWRRGGPTRWVLRASFHVPAAQDRTPPGEERSTLEIAGGRGGIGRRAGFRSRWSLGSLEVRVLSPALPTPDRSPARFASHDDFGRLDHTRGAASANAGKAGIRAFRPSGIERRRVVASCPRALLLRRLLGGLRLRGPRSEAPRPTLRRVRGHGPSAVRSIRWLSTLR